MQYRIWSGNNRPQMCRQEEEEAECSGLDFSGPLPFSQFSSPFMPPFSWTPGHPVRASLVAQWDFVQVKGMGRERKLSATSNYRTIHVAESIVLAHFLWAEDGHATARQHGGQESWRAGVEQHRQAWTACYWVITWNRNHPVSFEHSFLGLGVTGA